MAPRSETSSGSQARVANSHVDQTTSTQRGQPEHQTLQLPHSLSSEDAAEVALLAVVDESREK